MMTKKTEEIGRDVRLSFGCFVLFLDLSSREGEREKQSEAER